jgi:hypothetical protein
MERGALRRDGRAGLRSWEQRAAWFRSMRRARRQSRTTTGHRMAAQRALATLAAGGVR